MKLKSRTISQLSTSLVLLLLSFTTHAEIKTKETTYKLNDVNFQAYIAWDDSVKGKRPGVLVVHEWWGHNEYARKRARDIAKAGYVGFALDMYGDGKLATHPDDAGKFMKAITSNYDEMIARFNAAKQELTKFELVDPNNIAAIGYCFGGAVVLNAAREQNGLSAVVSFHGNLGAMEENNTDIKTPILVFNGGADPFVSQDSIDAFHKEMKQRNADYKFVNYKGVKHSFTNPGATAVGKKYELPLEYNAKADKKSWKQMKKFLNKNFNTMSMPGSRMGKSY